MSRKLFGDSRNHRPGKHECLHGIHKKVVIGVVFIDPEKSVPSHFCPCRQRLDH